MGLKDKIENNNGHVEINLDDVDEGDIKIDNNVERIVLDLEEEEVEPNNDILNFGGQQRNRQKDDIKK